jgi:Xaa-Pro aminopeptidase
MAGMERKESLRRALAEARLDALVCALPKNVLLLSGYWPVVGTGIAVALPDGGVRLCVPEDEEELARQGWPDHVQTFHPSSLDRITTAAEALKEHLSELLPSPTRGHARVGFEQGEDSEPSSYAAMHLYHCGLEQAFREAFPTVEPVAADEILIELRSVKTQGEISDIRTACEMTGRAFERGGSQLRAGLTELEAAELFRAEVFRGMPDYPDVHRAEAFIWAMSGQNSAKAHGAYARSRARKIEQGDLVLVHCNSCADGYWTDITRTFSIGAVDDQRQEIYSAVFAAREAAFGEIAPGKRASGVDRAARKILEERGFGAEFKHSTGHGVGFGAISPNAHPRLHPKSVDVLKTGMVFNVEPAVYIDGYGGIRHCDMVAVTESGFELLTPFQSGGELFTNRHASSVA